MRLEVGFVGVWDAAQGFASGFDFCVEFGKKMFADRHEFPPQGLSISEGLAEASVLVVGLGRAADAPMGIDPGMKHDASFDERHPTLRMVLVEIDADRHKFCFLGDIWRAEVLKLCLELSGWNLVKCFMVADIGIDRVETRRVDHEDGGLQLPLFLKTKKPLAFSSPAPHWPIAASWPREFPSIFRSR